MTSSERRGAHRLKNIAAANADAICEQRKHRMPYTAAPFLVLFSKKYREKELNKNTSEQLRLRTAVEFNGERKASFWMAGYQTPSATLVPLQQP